MRKKYTCTTLVNNLHNQILDFGIKKKWEFLGSTSKPRFKHHILSLM